MSAPLDNLVHFDAHDTSRLVPDLAVSWEQSSDGKTMTL